MSCTVFRQSLCVRTRVDFSALISVNDALVLSFQNNNNQKGDFYFRFPSRGGTIPMLMHA